jgi:hypothetical protein
MQANSNAAQLAAQAGRQARSAAVGDVRRAGYLGRDLNNDDRLPGFPDAAVRADVSPGAPGRAGDHWRRVALRRAQFADASGGGRWVVEFGETALWTREKVLAWRRLAAMRTEVRRRSSSLWPIAGTSRSTQSIPAPIPSA